MDLLLEGKRAIVSGGSRGIGLAVAEGLVAEGVDVVLAARGDEVLRAAERLAASSGQRVFGVRADSSDEVSVNAMVAEAVGLLGGVDILVNTAATPWSADMNVAPSKTSDDFMRAEFETKVLGYLRTARAVAPHLVAQGWGRIINVAGLAARSTGVIPQTMRNVAVASMTKNLADELGPKGINVTVVHPGLTRTPALTERLAERAASEGSSVEELEAGMVRNSVHRMIDASDVAAVVVFLASPRSIAVTGDPIAAGGGVPGPIYY